MYYTLFKYGLFRPGIALGMRPIVEGAENLPDGQAAIVAANHISAWDPIVLLAMIKPTVHMVAKKELFAPGGSLRHRIVASFLKAVEQVPMDRDGGAAGLQPVLDTLAAGEVVGIFPEGTRSPDGRLYRGKTGVARLALHSGVPVIPVAVMGTIPRRGPFGIPWISRPHYVIGEPLRYDDLAPLADDRVAVRWVTNDIMATIAQMTGQEYVDVYAADIKRGTATPEQITQATGVDPRHGEPRPRA